MDKRDEEFLKRIQVTFRTEATEHLRVISSDLIELEKTKAGKPYDELIETIFREVHSLKGAARSVDQKEIESVCHPLESMFAALKSHKISLNPGSFDLLYKTIENLSNRLLPDSATTHTFRQIQSDLIKQLKEAVDLPLSNSGNDSLKQSTKIQRPEKPGTADIAKKVTVFKNKIPGQVNQEVVRIPISKLDPLLFQAEELVQMSISLDQHIKEFKDLNNTVSLLKDFFPDREGSFSKGSFDNSKTLLEDLKSKSAVLEKTMERDQYSFNRMISEHLEDIRQVVMLPVSAIVESFPVMVREITREQNKEIDFNISGTEMEIDKRILDELKDPLIHLIRNCIDHGIENREFRILNHKLPTGNISLEFGSRGSGTVQIIISDDGKGINSADVVKSAIKSGYLTSDNAAKLNAEEKLSLIYQSGVSTGSIITDISGRGLGLSIVREKVEKLNGTISVETEINKGTTFRILLPVSLATFRSVTIRSGDQMFMIPAVNVEHVIKVEPQVIKTVENHETVNIYERVLPVVDLGEVLGINENKNLRKDENGSSGQITLVIIVVHDNRIAFKVDEVIDERPVLVKGLGKLLRHVKNISGATVLGNGRVVTVLNISDLMKSALLPSRKINGKASGEMVQEKIKKILVAEDSITARTLIKNILETAGYQVATAIDGTDAFTLARSNDFDLVVSDIDMPRMNGFELTAKIRKDHKLSEIPIVLVTALESREDREHGIEVGADAYIIKSSFDQTNLLETIKKLI